MIIYKFINPEAIPKPEELDTTKVYTTKIHNCYWLGTGYVIELEWIGEPMTDENRCLIPARVR